MICAPIPNITPWWIFTFLQRIYPHEASRMTHHFAKNKFVRIMNIEWNLQKMNINYWCLAVDVCTYICMNICLVYRIIGYNLVASSKYLLISHGNEMYYALYLVLRTSIMYILVIQKWFFENQSEWVVIANLCMK